VSFRTPSSPLRSASGRLRLRTQLFVGSALLSSAILAVAAWVINHQVVRQARQQVQTEVETLLPLYDAIWIESAQQLATLGATMAGSPIVKTVFGDPRASRDRATLREMLSDFSQSASTAIDIFLITDGAGQVTFAETRGVPIELRELPAARGVAESQKQHRGFVILGDKLFQLVLTPLLLHSGSVDYHNTLAVLGAGAELDRKTAIEIKRRIHCDILFLVKDALYASSFAPADEAQATKTVISSDVRNSDPTHPTEIRLNGELYLAFTRELLSSDDERVGQVVILRSLAEAGQLFQAISNRLVLLWTLSIAAALLLSYLIANRITRPIDSLVAGVEEFGRGNYEFKVSTDAHGEIGALARSFDAMRRSLKQTQTALLRSERLATIGQMASSIVHDLRNPLATITTAAEMLARDGIAHERRQTLIESQLRASDRMNEMLRELLEFSLGSYKLNLGRHSLAGIVERAIRELKPGIGRAGVEVEAHVPKHFRVQADDERLRRVFENLLINAAQAMTDGGQITITADYFQESRDQVRVAVIDNGPGVPAEVRERVFEPFVSYGKSGGTGLGLAIAQRVVAAHGGEIGLKSSEASGSEFYLVLPLDPDEQGVET